MGAGLSAGIQFSFWNAGGFWSWKASGDLRPRSVPTCERCSAPPTTRDNLHGLPTLTLMDRVFTTSHFGVFPHLKRKTDAPALWPRDVAGANCTPSSEYYPDRGMIYSVINQGLVCRRIGSVRNGCLCPLLEGWGISFTGTLPW